MSKRILIVEDDVLLSKSLTREFEDHGYIVETAAAVSQIKLQDNLDFAIVDLRLSHGEFGLNAIEIILEHSPLCRIVILSGYGSIATAVEAVKKGAVDYMTKPASFKDIEAALLGTRSAPNSPLKVQSLSEVEHEHIDFILTKNEGNISKTAKELGLHRQSLQRKLKKYT